MAKPSNTGAPGNADGTDLRGDDIAAIDDRHAHPVVVLNRALHQHLIAMRKVKASTLASAMHSLEQIRSQKRTGSRADDAR